LKPLEGKRSSITHSNAPSKKIALDSHDLMLLLKRHLQSSLFKDISQV
jgi:hypothetical protein